MSRTIRRLAGCGFLVGVMVLLDGRWEANAGVLWESWNAVPGNDVADLRRHPDFPSNPGGTELLAGFEIPERFRSSVGDRLRASLSPLQTGDYTFWISGATSAELWLASDDPETPPVLIAHVPNETSNREWDRYPEQKSAAIRLKSGVDYNLEVLHKVSVCCGDRLAVAWEGPDIDRQIITGDMLNAPEGLPVVALINPADGARFSDHADVSLAAEARVEMGRIARVDFYVAGVRDKRIGSVTEPPYELQWRDVPPGRYQITVRAIDDRGRVVGSAPVWIEVTGGTPLGVGSILRETWSSIPGRALADLRSDTRYPHQPDQREFLSGAELAGVWSQSVGNRLRGYVHPPRTGEYRFYVASTHESELYLSESDNLGDARPVARVGGEAGYTTYPRDWWKSSMQESAPLRLEAGRKYYLEVVHKVGDCCGDHLAVAWDVPGGAFEIIPGSNLSPLPLIPPTQVEFGADPGSCGATVWHESTNHLGGTELVFEPPSGSVLPVGRTQVTASARSTTGEAVTVVFGVTILDREPPVLRHPEFVLGGCGQEPMARVEFEVSAIDNCDPAPVVACLPASGSLFPIGLTKVLCVARDAAGNETQSEFAVVRQVTLDTELAPPATAMATAPFRVVSAETRGNTRSVTVAFSAAVDEVTALDPARYTVGPGVTVHSVTLLRFDTVRLETGGMPVGKVYALGMSGVRERGPEGRTVEPVVGLPFVQSQGVLTRKEFHGLFPDGFVVPTVLEALTNRTQFPDHPDRLTYSRRFEIPQDVADNYGVQLAGYLTPPLTGEYTFYLSSDDQGALFLSGNEHPTDKRLIAFEPNWSEERNWVGQDHRRPNRENISSPIPLEAGRSYYIEALMKEYSGGDRLAVTWMKPGDPEPTNGAPPIPGAYLSSLWPSEAAAIVRQPADVTVVEGGSAVLEIELCGTPPFDFQWHRNGEAMTAGIGPRLVVSNLSVADDGTVYHVVAGNGLSTMKSADATIHVERDETPPVLRVVAGSPTLDRVTLRFSEALRAEDVTLDRFTIDGGVAIRDARLLNDGQTVELLTSPQEPETRYVATASGLRDRASIPNVMEPSVTAEFTSFRFLPGGLRQDFFAHTCCGYLDQLMATSPNYPDYPDRTQRVTQAEASVKATDGHVVRLSGWLVPPVTGEYVFYLSSWREGVLYLSPGDQEEGKVRIAREPEGVPTPRDWVGTENRNPEAPANRSAPLHLVAGERYYLEAIMTSGESQGHLGVAWQRPGDPPPANGSAPIGAEYLGVYADPLDAVPEWVIEPEDAAVPVGEGATFVVAARADSPWISYQWERNGAAIQGANGATWSLEAVTLADDGARFRCVVKTGGGETTSREAVLRVVSEGIPPLPEGFARLTVTTRAGPVTVVVPRRTFTFDPAGTTYYLSTQGSDGAPGTLEEPWKTFAHAVSRLEPGDLLYVREGDYPEPFVIGKSGVLGKPIILSAYPGERVNIFPPPGWEPASGTTHGANTIQIDGSHIWIHGFEIMGPPRELGYRPLGTPILSAVQLGGGGVGCRILNNLCYRAQYTGIKDQTGSYDYLVEGNLCFDNGTPIDASYPAGSGLYLPSPTRRGTIIRGNASFSNGVSGFSHYHRGFGQHVYNNVIFGNGTEFGSFGLVTSGYSNVYAHNVIAANVSVGFSFYEATAEGFPSDNLVANSVFAGNTEYQLDKTFDDPLGNLVDHCLIQPWQSWASHPARLESVAGNGLVFASPLFVDESGHDYRLRSGSPGRGVAMPLKLPGSRPGPDIGLFPATLYWEPELGDLGTSTVDEGSELVVQARVANGNPLEARIEFQLADFPPRGMTIDKDSGEIRWTPGEEDGPGEYRITVVATADGSPVICGSRTFQVKVREANRPIQLGVAGAQFNTEPAGSIDLYADGAPRVPSQTVLLDGGGWRVEAHGGGFPGDNRNDFASFSWMEMVGDFDARVRVASLSASSPYTRAGLMIRESLAAKSRMEFVHVFPRGLSDDGYPAADGYGLDRRSETGANTFPVIERSPEAPFPNAWIRLERSGSSLASYRSSNGRTWTLLHRETVPYPPVVFLGMAVFPARSETTMSTRAEFRDLEVRHVAPVSAEPATVDEGELVAIRMAALDLDRPSQTVRFSLGDEAPEGVVMNPISGKLEWRPGEEHGPGVYQIPVRAMDNGTPSQSTEVAVEVHVREVNQPPVLESIADRAVEAGQSLEFLVSARDDDVPANALVYSISGSVPEGLVLTREGRFHWTPGEGQDGRTYEFVVMVSDDAVPAGTDSEAFRVTVPELERPIEFTEVHVSSSGLLTLRWTALALRHYRIQAADDLGSGVWEDLDPEIQAKGLTAAIEVPIIEAPFRFFRVRRVP